jgi:hypothetical protein
MAALPKIVEGVGAFRIFEFFPFNVGVVDGSC